MKGWIEKNIDPPGLEKKNRGSLFSAVGEIFGAVKADAGKAFKSRFPYLCDPQKLKEHGGSLGIPEFPFDSEGEFRERVSTASFFLARSGERAYILEQMRRHFGDGFVLKEEFLKVLVNIAELNEADRVWVHSLLDGLLNPNIQLTVAEWFRFIDYMPMGEGFSLKAERRDRDSYAGRFLCNGQFYCDQGTEILCGGTWLCDGSIKADRFIPAGGTVSDYISEGVYADGRHTCNGGFDCSGLERVYSPAEFEGPVTPSGGWEETFAASLFMEPVEDAMRIAPVCDGRFMCDGSNTAPVADGPLFLRIIRELRCNGVRRPSCGACDGSITCGGSYEGYDGLYYAGNRIHEEVLW